MNIDRRNFLTLVAAAGTAAAMARPSSAAETFELEEITVGDLQNGMREGRFNAHSLAEAYLQRIDAIDKHGPALNAVIELNPEDRKSVV